MAAIDETTSRAMGASVRSPAGTYLTNTQGIDDMITLNNMTEESMLKNLQVRYAKDIIYVLPIYSPDIVKRYVGQMIGKLPPHIFAIADTAFRLMRDEQRNQSVIISGESGAGKTEATKLILQYLAAMTAKHSEVEQAILESSPVMEAFGNAKTVRNNNSSRFGKFIEVNFNAAGAICGAKMQQFLLEKSRITFQAPNERNYHIFYQLCAGASAEERRRMYLDDASKFWYTNQGGETTIEGVDDAEDFDRVKQAMSLLGMSGQLQVLIFNMVAAVLHAGNINFKSDGKDGSVITNRNELEITAKLLMVDPAALEKALTIRINKIRGESIVVPLNPAQAVNTRDALAKALYSRLFDWLVSTINLAIDKSRGTSKNFIGVLDIFGFENFKVNSFEQLCINFANEKLQQHFNQTIFKLEQDEYDREKINWSKIQFNDNQETIDLIEKLRPPGIIAILDEETKFPKATDHTFLEKCHANFGKHDSYEKPKLSKTTFVVKHYAGAVSYEVKDFLEKNKDTLREDLLTVLAKSSSNLVIELFKDVAAEGDEKAKKVPTVGTNFKNSLVSLMATLNATHPHYIRCIKPNSLKIPSTFDADMVLAQLRYAGMLETIRIRRLGYPIRYPFNDFFRRYNVINPFVKPGANMGGAIGEIMKKAKSLQQGDWQIGVTKVFLREKQYQALEEERNQKIMGSVIKIQSWWRMASTRKYYLYVRYQAILIQAHYKGYRQRMAYLKMTNGAILIQAWFRMYRMRKKYKPIIKQRREEAKRRALEEKRRAEEAARAAAAAAAAPPRSPRGPSATVTAEDNNNGDLQGMDASEQAQGGTSPRGGYGSQQQQQQQGTQMPRGSMRKSVIGAAPRVQTMRLPQGITPDASELRYDASKDFTAGTMTLKRKQMKFLTVIPEPKPIITPQEARQYRFLDYANRHFQRHTEKGLFKKDKVLSFEEMITACKRIDAPLHNNLRTPEQQKLAVEIFTRANAYIDMGAKVGWDHAQFILGRGLQMEDMRDEIYAQMMKLTIGVARRDQLLKAWELLCLVAGTFPPSEALVKYAAAHMQETVAGGDPKDEVTQMAQFTRRRLERVVELPKRFMVPGIAEIAAVRERKPIVCRFDFLDGNKKAMYIDSQTTSKEVFGILAEKIGLKDPVGYAIYECYNNLERSLNENDNLADALAKFERFEADCKTKNIKVTFRFLFKRKLYLDPRQMSSDSVENSLMFYQAMHELFTGRLPCRESDAIRFGALKLQIEYGDSAGSTALNAGDQLPLFVPRTLWAMKTPEEWRQELRTEHSKHVGKSKEECKFLFLREAKKLEYYGDTIFTVSHKSEWAIPAKFDLAVGKSGVHFLSESRQRAYSFTLDQVDNMYYTPKTMKLFFVTDAGVQKNIELQTLQGIEIASLIAEYQYWLDQDSQWCRATQDYINNDYSLLSFSTGDLIFVMNKDESGWWTGECNGKQGIFPCDHVQVLLTPPEQVRPSSMAPGGGGGSGISRGSTRDSLLGNSRLSNARASVRGSAYTTSKSGRVIRESTSGEQQNFTTQQFSLAKFAEQFFRKSETKKQSGLATLSRSQTKTVAVELTQRLSYSREPISESLLEIDNSLVSRAAVEVFNQILRYMNEDSAKKSRFRYAQTVVTGGLNAEELRNEVYCQLMKQTTNCPRADMCARAWELLVLCLACFLPSKSFLPYLIAYINDHRNAPGDIARLAKLCLERQHRTNMRGQRKRAPSTEEISQLLSGGQVVVRVHLLDGNAKACYIDSATIVAEVFSDIKSQLGVAALDGWSFYEVAPAIEYERPLKESDNVCDLMAAWELYEKPKNVTKDVLFSLLFKKKIFLDPRRDDPSDPVLGPLIYAQAVDNVIRGRYPVTQDEAILLGALQLQAQYGDQTSNKGQVLTEATISHYVPAPLLGQRMSVDWIKQLSAAYGRMAGKQQAQARRLYVEKMMEWPLYGSTVFFCKQKQAPVDISIALNVQGIHILERGSKNPIKSYPYTQISNWSPAENAFTIIVGSLVKPLRYVFETGEAAHMSELFQAYVDALVMQRQQEKKATATGTRGKFF